MNEIILTAQRMEKYFDDKNYWVVVKSSSPNKNHTHSVNSGDGGVKIWPGFYKWFQVVPVDFVQKSETLAL